jgi:hypothetical protein
VGRIIGKWWRATVKDAPGVQGQTWTSFADVVQLVECCLAMAEVGRSSRLVCSVTCGSPLDGEGAAFQADAGEFDPRLPLRVEVAKR